MIDFLDIILIIIVFIAIALFGGLIYLIYLPFKRHLIKSGKLTNKLNRQVNLTFILLLCLLSLTLYYFNNYSRTSSKDRVEKISNVNLPTDFKVLKDEYQDMMQDYCVLYDIQFDKNSTTKFIESIKASKFYNAKSLHKGAWTQNDFILTDSTKAVWAKSPNGFAFTRQDKLTSYYIQLDTVTNTLKYTECAD